MYKLKSLFGVPVLVSLLLLPASWSLGAETAPVSGLVRADKDAVVARVNGTAITAAQLAQTVHSLMQTQPEAKLSPETLKKVEANVLEGLISQALLFQAGSKLEVRDLDRQAQERIGKLRAGFADEGYFQEALKAQGMTEADAYEAARHDLVIANFIQKTIVDKLSVNGAESRAYYERNLDRYAKPEMVRVSHVLIGVDAKASPEEKQRARARAEALRQELLKGAAFAEVAKKNSSCSSAGVGGDLGYVARGALVPAFEKVAFALKPGELSQVVETRFGFHIIKLRDHRDAVTTPFSEVKAEIEKNLKNQKTQEATGKFLAEARRDAKIEVLLK